ncbi:MAG TPA: hypothetical protein VEF76_07235 [Patescibacteria group bacterium]|nr:hypothetical protein [Patescibacteria group bacterium]
MKLCKYWDAAETTAPDATGKILKLRKWGGSNTSLEDAQRQACAALDALVAGLGARVFRGHDYSYSMREVPEELVQEISDTAGVTRNARGCLVLNTADAFFADIDIPEPGFFARLFGASKEKAEQAALSKLRTFIAAHPGAGARIYRTRAGLRYLFTHAPVPMSEESIGWLEALGSDKLYVRLCKNQKCYRARLTPKPWRIGCGAIAGHYPYRRPEHAEGFRNWLRDYEEKCRAHATCSLVGTEGETRLHPALSPIVTLHDKLCRIHEPLPLA